MHDEPAQRTPVQRPSALTHVDATGAARMVDVSAKAVTARTASAGARVELSPAAYALVDDGRLPKGDALGVARIAGIMASKKTPELIPLCHPIAVSGVVVDVSCLDGSVRIEATVRTTDRTGVEMEALTAVAVAGLAVIDMVKGVDPLARLTDVEVLTKTGGVHGDWDRGQDRSA
jgi:cyclic pyranopterin phosphate synthase